MQIKKGRVLFGYKDTRCMEDKLSEVIVAGLVKYKEVINEDEPHKGVPQSIIQSCEEQGLIPKTEGWEGHEEEDLDIAYNHFKFVLDEMIYAFGGDVLLKSFTLECTNEEESKRYNKDMIEHNKRCDKGREYFSKHFNALWW